jgi:hypothetical protein
VFIFWIFLIKLGATIGLNTPNNNAAFLKTQIGWRKDTNPFSNVLASPERMLRKKQELLVLAPQ